MNKVLTLGAIAGPILFTAAWAILGVVSPGYTLWDIHIAPYSAVSQPISGLGLGPTGPFMNSAFVLSSLLLLGGVVGIVGSIPELGPRAAGAVRRCSRCRPSAALPTGSSRSSLSCRISSDTSSRSAAPLSASPCSAWSSAVFRDGAGSATDCLSRAHSLSF